MMKSKKNKNKKTGASKEDVSIENLKLYMKFSSFFESNNSIFRYMEPTIEKRKANRKNCKKDFSSAATKAGIKGIEHKEAVKFIDNSDKEWQKFISKVREKLKKNNKKNKNLRVNRINKKAKDYDFNLATLKGKNGKEIWNIWIEVNSWVRPKKDSPLVFYIWYKNLEKAMSARKGLDKKVLKNEVGWLKSLGLEPNAIVLNLVAGKDIKAKTAGELTDTLLSEQAKTVLKKLIKEEEFEKIF